MSKQQSKQKSALRVATTVMATTGLIAGAAHANTETNPFGYQELSNPLNIAAGHKEGRCGEGQCGEGQCGEGQCGNKKKDKGKKGQMHMKMRMMEQKIDKMMMMMEDMQKKMK